MPIPGSRYRDNRSGMSGPHATLRQYLQACTHPRWAMNVGLAGRPLSFGNIEAYTGHKMTMDDYMGFISNNFDPSIAWHDLEWIRDSWQGKLIIKGILDADDARTPCGWAPMVLWCRIMAADSLMAPSPPPGRCPGWWMRSATI